MDAIAFDTVAETTDDPVVTIEVRTPAGTLRLVGEPVIAVNVMTVRGFHVLGASPHAIGPVNLRMLAEAMMERLGLDGLVVEGALRTTGAGPGRRPRPLRFAPRRRAAPGA